MRVTRLIERQSPLRFLVGVVAPIVATLVCLAIGDEKTTAAALVYLLALFAAAAIGGLGPGVLASVLSFLGLNFFFTPPRRTFSVGKTDDLVALVVFITVGMAVSSLVAVGLAQRARAERRELEARSLYAISSRLLATDDLDGALAELAAAVRRLFGLARCEVRIRTDDGSLSLRASDGDAGPGAEEVTVVLKTSDRDLGALVMMPAAGLGEAERRVAAIFARQTAAALERGILEQEAGRARVEVETNRVRRALLSAVSHDFKTPLASIKAALTSLTPDIRGGEDRSPALASPDAQELLRTAIEETERLERLVANLLDLTRIRSGALAPERMRIPVEDVLEEALTGLRASLEGLRVEVMVRPDVPLLEVDPVQVGQVFRNVLQNAGAYAPEGTSIRIAASTWQGAVEVRVADRGPGIPAAHRVAVFEEFFRTGDGRAAGTGLGLAVAKAIVEAHGGAIWVEDTPGGGATIVVRLPAASAR